MKTSLLIALGLVGPAVAALAQERITLSGYVREAGSQELLPGVSLYVPNSANGTVTNNYGFYSLTLPAADTLTLLCTMIGYQPQVLRIAFRRNLTHDWQLLPGGRQLDEVVVHGAVEKERVSQDPQMSQVEIPVAQIKKLPALLGEKDVLKALQLMPGVQKGTEGQSGLYVRGGGPDQNLIILDDAIVYNASHLFGFFSVFNGDALKSVELTKGGFPARYGGRLSSVVEMQMKEGSREKLHGEGGIGVLSSRLTLEGPLVKGKSSFLVSGRRTYIDVLTRPFMWPRGDSHDVAGYYFYDLNAKVNYDLGPKDRLYLSGYFGQDRYYFSSQTTYNGQSSVRREEARGGLNWGNATATLRWNHLFTQRIFGNASLIFSNYRFNVFARNSSYTVGQDSSGSAFRLNYLSAIQDISLKYDLDYFAGPQHTLRLGVQAIRHHFVPSTAVYNETSQTPFLAQATPQNSLEAGLYAEDIWKPVRWLKINVGLRGSVFQARHKTYLRPEPRLSGAITAGRGLALKASYARMNQYVHLLSNTGLGLPTDLWVPTTDRVAPQQSEQVAAGLAKDFEKQGFAVTLEGYYKTMHNIISYREGASFLSIGAVQDGQGYRQVTWEDNLTAGRGWAYGGELLIQKKEGRFTGWLGYTLSWTKWQFPELNGGRVFFPRYDRRHDVSVVGIYELSKRITLSSTWVYGTGNALNMPTGMASLYPFLGGPVPPTPGPVPARQALFGYGQAIEDFSQRNSFRAEAYHRMDVALQFHKQKRRHQRTWELSAYNLYNRRNPFFYTIDGRVLKRVSVFPVVPSVSYQFKF